MASPRPQPAMSSSTRATHKTTAKARVAVEEERDRGRLGHERHVVHHLRPGQLVVVAHAEGRRDRQPAAPDALEPGLLDDACGEPAVRFHQEGDLRARDEPLERGRAPWRHRLARKRSRISAGLYGMRGTSASSAVVFTSTKCGPSAPSAARTADSVSAAVVTAVTV